MLLIKPAFETV